MVSRLVPADRLNRSRMAHYRCNNRASGAVQHKQPITRQGQTPSVFGERHGLDGAGVLNEMAPLKTGKVINMHLSSGGPKGDLTAVRTPNRRLHFGHILG